MGAARKINCQFGRKMICGSCHQDHHELHVKTECYVINVKVNVFFFVFLFFLESMLKLKFIE